MDDDRSLSDKLSGRFRHPEDAGGRTILTGKLLRSPIPRGRITVLDLPEPPEGVVSLVSRDIPGATRLNMGNTAIPVLSGRDILWDGQPVLAAAGPDPEALDHWFSEIRMETSPLQEEEPTGDAGGFTMARGDLKEAFGRAFQVIEEIVTVPAIIRPGKTRSVSCIRDGSAYVIHSATAWPGAVHRAVTRVLKVDTGNVRVRPYPSRGKIPVWMPAIDACRAALLSRAARKSVRLTTSATESTLRDPRTPEVEFTIRGALDGEGRVLALDVRFRMVTGAIFPLEKEFLDRMVMGLFSVYPCRTYAIEGELIRKPIAPSSHGPAIGFEIGFLAGETFATRVAEHSLIPPGTWRRESLPVTGQPFGPGISLPRDFPLPEIIAKVVGLSDFERKQASFEQTRLGHRNLNIKPGKSRGIGLACAWFGNGFIASPREMGGATVNAVLDKDGILTIGIPAHTVGPAMLRAWAGMAADILGMDHKSVRFPVELPSDAGNPGPSILGRNASVYTKLIEQACNDISKRRFRDALPIRVTRNRRRSARQPWNAEEFEGTAFETVSWGAVVAEAEISSADNVPGITRIWTVIDGGRLLMPDHAKMAVEASIQNAVEWSLGSVATAPMMDIHFHGDVARRPPRDITTLPWLMVPAACVQAVRQAADSNTGCIPLSRGLWVLNRGRTGGAQ